MERMMKVIRALLGVPRFRGRRLLANLKQNITDTNSVDEIIDVFEKMCKIEIEDDLLLLEYGVYNFTGKDLFYFELVRQFPDGFGEYFQVRASLLFAPDQENKLLRDTLWSEHISANFFDYIRKCAGYRYAKNHKFQSVVIRMDQT